MTTDTRPPREQLERMLERLYDDGYAHGPESDAHLSIVQTTNQVVDFIAEWLANRAGRISDHQPEALEVAEWFMRGWQEDMKA